VEPADLLIQDEAQTFGRPNQLFAINLCKHVHILQGGDHQQPPGASTDSGMHLLMESLAEDAPGLRSAILRFLPPRLWQTAYIASLGVQDELLTADPWAHPGAVATTDPACAHLARAAELAARTLTAAALPQPTSIAEFIGGSMTGCVLRPQQLLLVTSLRLHPLAYAVMIYAGYHNAINFAKEGPLPGSLHDRQIKFVRNMQGTSPARQLMD
jgi:hypothetical protein